MTSEQRWDVRSALAWTTEHLESAGIENSRLEAERMLSSATGLSRVELYAYHDRMLSPEERTAYREAIKRRASGEPLQYIVGEVAFRRIVLKVRPGVFIPRPETEILAGAVVDWLEEAGKSTCRVLDLCTGTGAVALSIAREVPGAVVVAVDLSEEACACATANSERLQLTKRVEIRQGDLFEALDADDRFDVVVANPPYVPSGSIEGLQTEVRDHEPQAALDGGEEGLDVIREIAAEAVRRLAQGGLLALEVDSGHAKSAASCVADAGLTSVEVIEDLAGRPRVVIARG